MYKVVSSIHPLTPTSTITPICYTPHSFLRDTKETRETRETKEESSSKSRHTPMVPSTTSSSTSSSSSTLTTMEPELYNQLRGLQKSARELRQVGAGQAAGDGSGWLVGWLVGGEGGRVKGCLTISP